MFVANKPPSSRELAKVRKIMRQSEHLKALTDFLASFCCEGGFVLVEYIVPYIDPFDTNYVGRCLQDIYEVAGGSSDTRPHVFFEAIKLRFGDLPAFYEMFQKLMIETINGIRAEFPGWNVMSDEEFMWQTWNPARFRVHYGPLSSLIKGVLVDTLAEVAPWALETNT